MTERNSSNTFAITMLAGITGMFLALLLAPRSGQETRRKINMAAGDLKDRTAEGMDTARANAEDGLRQAKAIKSRLSEAISARGKKTGRNNNKDTNSPDSVQSPILTSWDEEV